MHLRLLRLVLVACAVTWGAAVVGVFVSWKTAAGLLTGLGAGAIAYDPMVDYWLRMTAGAFTLIGALFLLLAIRPHKYRASIPWFGALMILEGLILLAHGIRLALPPFPFYADTAACLLGGAAIFWLSPRANYESTDPNSQSR